MSMKLVSYNVLAETYIKPERYPHTDPEWLKPAIRQPALLSEIVAMNADIIALQEVEPPVFEALRAMLPDHVAQFERKGGGRPDGCATFVRAKADDISWTRLEFADGVPTSGHVALLAIVTSAGQRLGVANTHLRWSPPGTPRTQHVGARQLDELLATCLGSPCDGWVVCGDLNCVADSLVLQPLSTSGFVSAHAHMGADFPTCAANSDPRQLDHIFVRGPLDVIGHEIALITADTPLPSAKHPSDHLPVTATLSWRNERS